MYFKYFLKMEKETTQRYYYTVLREGARWKNQSICKGPFYTPRRIMGPFSRKRERTNE